MTANPAETDPMFTLLTDALRAGPGSPQWSEAVARLRESGAATAEGDEYQLLIHARENLESGKPYRAVRAGAGFTRKLMGQLDEEAQSARAFPLANVIALLCGLAIVASLAFLIYHLASPAPAVDQQAIEQLAAESRTFITDIASADFTQGGVPADWRSIGSPQVTTPQGLSSQAQSGAQANGGATGGGVYLPQEIASDRDFMVEAELELPRTPAPVALEVFVANSDRFSADRATSPTELVWLTRGGEQQVVAAGHVDFTGKSPAGTLPLRIIVGHDVAIVEVGQRAADGKITFSRVWAGNNRLGTSARYVGVRFLRSSASQNADGPFVKRVRIASK